MLIGDLLLTVPALLIEPRFVGLSTDVKPTIMPDNTGMAVPVGTEFREYDTGKSWYFDGSVWQPMVWPQKFDQLVELNFRILEQLEEMNAKK